MIWNFIFSLSFHRTLTLRLPGRRAWWSGRCMGTCNKSTCSERVCTDPPILGHLQLPVAAGHLQQPPAAATSSNINHLQLFLQLAAATCSNINHLQRLLAARKSLRKIHKNLNNNKGPTQKIFKKKLKYTCADFVQSLGMGIIFESWRGFHLNWENYFYVEVLL